MSRIIHSTSRRHFNLEVLAAAAVGTLPGLGWAREAAAQPLAASPPTSPITAVSFPKEVIRPEGGRIEFWAKLADGTTGPIAVGGSDPHFFQITDIGEANTYHMGFNSNDGAANGGLIGVVGREYFCGTGVFGSYTYEDVYGRGHVSRWHYYSFRWHPARKGVRKCYIYIDHVVAVASWHAVHDLTFPPLENGTFNLITTGGAPPRAGGPMQMHNLRIWDLDYNLILHNTLGSQEEVENSRVGPAGSFNGFGDAQFIANAHGTKSALQAQPVSGL